MTICRSDKWSRVIPIWGRYWPRFHFVSNYTLYFDWAASWLTLHRFFLDSVVFWDCAKFGWSQWMLVIIVIFFVQFRTSSLHGTVTKHVPFLGDYRQYQILIDHRVLVYCFCFWLPTDNVCVSKIALARTKDRGCIDCVIFCDDVLLTHLTLNSLLKLVLITIIIFRLQLLLCVSVLRVIIFWLLRFSNWFYYLRFSQNHALQTLIFLLKLDNLGGQIANCALLPDLQHLLKKNNLFLKFAHCQIISCIKVVALNFLHNVSCSVCKLECAHSFLDRVGRRAHSGNQVCLCASRKRFLQQSGQLWVAVGQEVTFIRKLLDDLSKSSQTEVDVLEFWKMT